MTRTFRFAVLIAVFALLFSMVPATAQADEPVTVKIAVVGSGAVSREAPSRYGMERATQLAVSDYASELASAGVAVSIVARDDRGRPSTAVSAAKAVVADAPTVGVVGHTGSSCSISASQVYRGAHLAMVTPSSTDPALTRQGLNNVSRTCGTDTGAARFAARVLARNLGLTRAYVVCDSTSYGRRLGSAFTAEFKACGGKIVGQRRTRRRQKDFGWVVKKIKAAKPKAVFYGGSYPVGNPFVRQLKRKLPKALVVGGDGLIDRRPVGITGNRTPTNGTLAACVGLPPDQTLRGEALIWGYRRTFPGQIPNASDACAYDAAAAVIRAVVSVAKEDGAGALQGSSARELVRAKVATSRFEGVSGTVAFNSAGDRARPLFAAWRVRSGVWKPCAQIERPRVRSDERVWPNGTTGIRLNKWLSANGWLCPRHKENAKAVTLRFYHRQHSRWVLRRTARARVHNICVPRVGSAYSARVKLPAKGRWRVYAAHSDGRHPYMRSTNRYLTVR